MSRCSCQLDTRICIDIFFHLKKSKECKTARPIRYSTYAAAPFWPNSGWGTGQRCRLDVTGSNVVNPQFRRQPTPLYCRQLTGCRHCPLIGESWTPSCKRLNVSHKHHNHPPSHSWPDGKQHSCDTAGKTEQNLPWNGVCSFGPQKKRTVLVLHIARSCRNTDCVFTVNTFNSV